MHKLMEYICDELEELERKVEKENKLSMAEIEYGDKLAHFKKNLLSSDQLWEDSEYSENMMYARGGSRGRSNTMGGSRMSNGMSYARGGRSGRGGRRGANQYGSYVMEGGYSNSSDMIEDLRELMQEAPDERTRQKFQRFINEMEQM